MGKGNNMTNNPIFNKIFEVTYHDELVTTPWLLSSAEVIKNKKKKIVVKDKSNPVTDVSAETKHKPKPNAKVLNTKGRSIGILGELFDSTHNWLANKTELLKKRALKKTKKPDEIKAIHERYEQDKSRHTRFKAECTNIKLCQRAGCAFCSGLVQRINTHAGHDYFKRNNLFNNKENPLVLATFMLDDYSIQCETAIRYKSTQEKVAFLKSEAEDILTEIGAEFAVGGLDFSWCIDKRTHVSKSERRAPHWMPHMHLIMRQNDYAAFRKEWVKLLLNKSEAKTMIRKKKLDSNPKATAYLYKRLTEVQTPIKRETVKFVKKSTGVETGNSRGKKPQMPERYHLIMYLLKKSVTDLTILHGLAFHYDAANGTFGYRKVKPAVK
jgi:hypothetical protein